MTTLLLGAPTAIACGTTARQRCSAGVFIALCTASHPLLDGLLDCGICNAWVGPLDGARHSTTHAVVAARASGGWAGNTRAERTRRRAAMRVMGTVLFRKAVV